MNIEFKKSDLNKLSNYTELYRKCFDNFPLGRDENYLDWLYNKNPQGKFIGIDAFDKDKGIVVDSGWIHNDNDWKLGRFMIHLGRFRVKSKEFKWAKMMDITKKTGNYIFY